jgi:hypothetical protein
VTDISCSGYSIRYVSRPTCRGSEPFVHAPLSYKRGGIQRYKISSIWTTQALRQYITQWSRVLCSGGLNHSKSLCVLVFFPFSN